MPEWQDLLSLLEDENYEIRKDAGEHLAKAFSNVPDKNQAWKDLLRLSQSGDSVAVKAAYILGQIFPQVPDKNRAWKDLFWLSRSGDSFVRLIAVDALGRAFQYVPDKQIAWHDLHALEEEKYSRYYPYMTTPLPIPDGEGYWLSYFYHSLGRASLFKSIEAKSKDTLRNELKASIDYFNQSLSVWPEDLLYQCISGRSERELYGPSRFCSRFYLAYFLIIFQQGDEDEIQEYLTRAKEACDSKSKEELVGAIDNLAKALRESQKLKERPIQEIAYELNTYRWYCEKADEHMRAAEGKAPIAVKLMKTCNPILEKRIRSTFIEIQKTAAQICKITYGSGGEYEVLGAEINKASKSLSSDDLHRTQRCTFRIASQIKEFCKLLPEGKKERVCGAVEEIEMATEFPDKLDKIELALTYVSSAVEAVLQSENTIETILKALEKKGDPDQRFKELLDRLEAVITELDRESIDDPAIKDDIDEAGDCLNDPEMSIKNRLVVTIPLVPILLTYQGIIELQSGLSLLAAWNKLISYSRKRKS